MSSPAGDASRAGSAHQWPRLAAWAVLIALVVASLGFAASRSSGASYEEQFDEVVSALRCPTCAGESVSDSAAPMAEGMRAITAEQLEHGSSPAEIRDWFVQRYGDEILLDPPRRGTGWLLWSLPLLLCGVAAVVVGARWAPARRVAIGAGAVTICLALGAAWIYERDGAAVSAASEELSQHTVDTADVLAESIRHRPGEVDLVVVLAGVYEARGEYHHAAEQYGAAVRLLPQDPDLRYRQAFSTFRTEDFAATELLLIDNLRLEPEHPGSLLLLGVLYHHRGDPRADEVLSDLRAVAPEHPALTDLDAFLADPAASGRADEQGGGPTQEDSE